MNILLKVFVQINHAGHTVNWWCITLKYDIITYISFMHQSSALSSIQSIGSIQEPLLKRILIYLKKQKSHNWLIISLAQSHSKVIWFTAGSSIFRLKSSHQFDPIDLHTTHELVSSNHNTSTLQGTDENKYVSSHIKMMHISDPTCSLFGKVGII